MSLLSLEHSPLAYCLDFGLYALLCLAAGTVLWVGSPPGSGLALLLWMLAGMGLWDAAGIPVASVCAARHCAVFALACRAPSAPACLGCFSCGGDAVAVCAASCLAGLVAAGYMGGFGADAGLDAELPGLWPAAPRHPPPDAALDWQDRLDAPAPHVPRPAPCGVPKPGAQSRRQPLPLWREQQLLGYGFLAPTRWHGLFVANDKIFRPCDMCIIRSEVFTA